MGWIYRNTGVVRATNAFDLQPTVHMMLWPPPHGLKHRSYTSLDPRPPPLLHPSSTRPSPSSTPYVDQQCTLRHPHQLFESYGCWKQVNPALSPSLESHWNHAAVYRNCIRDCIPSDGSHDSVHVDGREVEHSVPMGLFQSFRPVNVRSKCGSSVHPTCGNVFLACPSVCRSRSLLLQPRDEDWCNAMCYATHSVET